MQKSSMFRPICKALCICSIILLSACSGWRLANSVSSEPRTVSIPYVHGDPTGELTRRVVESVNSLPGYSVDESGQYVLSIKLLDDKEDKIGFRYDPIKLHHGKKDLILSESRTKALVEVRLIDRFTNKTVSGPAHILGSADFDHQENTINNDINDFSLGQLSDIDATEDVTYIPLYRDLGQKIGIWLQAQGDLTS